MKFIAITIGVLAALLVAAFMFTQWQALRISEKFPPRGAFASIADGRIHYTDIKPHQDNALGTIVLLHGASGNESDMRLALGELLAARGYRVLSMDRPGQGWSTRGAAESTPAQQALQVRQALETLGIGKAVIAGHSIAGAMTLQLALDHTDIVEGVVLIAPVTHPWPGGVAAYYSVTAAPFIGPVFVHTLMLPAALTIFDTALANVFAPQAPPENYRIRTGVELVLRPGAFRANAQDVNSMLAFVSREHQRYKDIKIPVAIISGDQDKTVLTHIHSYGSARDISGSKLHMLDGVGHSPHWARPDEVSAIIAALSATAQAARTSPR